MNHKDFTINKVPHFLHQISLKACLPWSLLLDSQWLLYITDMVGLESKCLNRIFYNWAGVRNEHPPYKYPFKLGVGEFVYVSGCIFRGRGFTTPHRQKYNIIVLNTTTIKGSGAHCCYKQHNSTYQNPNTGHLWWFVHCIWLLHPSKYLIKAFMPSTNDDW